MPCSCVLNKASASHRCVEPSLKVLVASDQHLCRSCEGAVPLIRAQSDLQPKTIAAVLALKFGHVVALPLLTVNISSVNSKGRAGSLAATLNYGLGRLQHSIFGSQESMPRVLLALVGDRKDYTN